MRLPGRDKCCSLAIGHGIRCIEWDYIIEKREVLLTDCQSWHEV